MASGIANVVSFCQPLGTSKTVCHVPSSRRLMCDLPELPPIPIDCSANPPTCTPTRPENQYCWIILGCIMLSAAVLLLFVIWKGRYFKVIFWINSHDNESRSGTDGPPDVDVELDETDVETTPQCHRRSEIQQSTN
ncbi:uncharacterized protein [Asterias amurensis]|uniref:uncharacterized protein n=1 Tax=Asterias amurensis TaxID=7602 RepID=UPI003AB11C52